MINSQTLVRVKPQSYGIGIYNTWRGHQIDNDANMTPGYPYRLQPIDENGFAVMPFGVLMAMYGSYMMVHRERPIDESQIEILINGE